MGGKRRRNTRRNSCLVMKTKKVSESTKCSLLSFRKAWPTNLLVCPLTVYLGHAEAQNIRDNANTEAWVFHCRGAYTVSLK